MCLARYCSLLRPLQCLHSFGSSARRPRSSEKEAGTKRRSLKQFEISASSPMQAMKAATTDEWVGPERLKVKVLWKGDWYPS